MRWLYQYEAKGIQGFITGTEKLREMAGASSLIEDLKEKVEYRVRQGAGEILVNAAGKATVLFRDDDSLRKFAIDWPFELAQASPGLQTIQAWVPGDSVDARERLVEKLAAARNIAAPDLPEAGPLASRAARTGRPAVRSARFDGLQDASTAAKSRRSQDRDELVRRIFPENLEAVQNAEHFGEGHIAVVHADGNGVGGRILQLAGAPGALAKFSSELSNATQAAAKASIARLAREPGALLNEAGGRSPGEAVMRSRMLLLRPIVLGGDDFTVILPARFAIPFAETYLRLFEEETSAREAALGGKLTACAGIAIVKTGFPFSSASRLAEELCRYAKARTARSGPASSSLSFHRTTTPMFLSLEHSLRAELSNDSALNGALLGGPWDLQSVTNLRALVEALKDLPRGSLREWLRVVRLSGSRAGAMWKRMLQVLLDKTPPKDRKSPSAAFIGVMTQLGCDPQTGFSADGRTPILDAMTWRGVAGSASLSWSE